MSYLKHRVKRLEGKSHATGIQYMWVEPDWSPSDIAAREVRFRSEHDIPASVEVRAIGWQQAQDNEVSQA